jgi:hypothetical protein
MSISTESLRKLGSVFLFVNGFIFIFYALVVPVFVHGVHWLITLVAILFLVALPAIYHSLIRVRKGVAKVVAVLFGFAMIMIVVSDLLFVLSILSALSHELAYALGNGVFVFCLLAIGVLALKGVFSNWFGYLSVLTAIIGLSTYIPGGSGLLSIISLLLLAAWSFALGFNILRLAA